MCAGCTRVGWGLAAGPNLGTGVVLGLIRLPIAILVCFLVGKNESGPDEAPGFCSAESRKCGLDERQLTDDPVTTDEDADVGRAGACGKPISPTVLGMQSSLPSPVMPTATSTS